MEYLIDAVRRWVPIAVGITLLAALVYTAAQQVLRHSANDPQIQVAEDTASLLSGGRPPHEVVPTTTVNIAQSLALYTIVFDETGQPVAASAVLNCQTPTPPSGVFDYVRQHGEERFSWQPAEGVRSAAVMIHYAGATRSGFVPAGRSLREVEKREGQLLILVGLFWAITLAATLAATLLAECAAARYEAD